MRYAIATLQPIALDNSVFHRGGIYRVSSSRKFGTHDFRGSDHAVGIRVARSPRSYQRQDADLSAQFKRQNKDDRHKSGGKKSRRAPRSAASRPLNRSASSQIQQALIREHYLSGDATGKWDATTQAAMQKYQADQGWQTKLMPDSRALKKLGLGPDYSNAINATNSSFRSTASGLHYSIGTGGGLCCGGGRKPAVSTPAFLQLIAATAVASPSAGTHSEAQQCLDPT